MFCRFSSGDVANCSSGGLNASLTLPTLPSTAAVLVDGVAPTVAVPPGAFAAPLAVLQSDPTLPLASARDAAVNFDATVEGYDSGYGLVCRSGECG